MTNNFTITVYPVPLPSCTHFPLLPDKLCEQAEEVQTTLKKLVKAPGTTCIIPELSKTG